MAQPGSDFVKVHAKRYKAWRIVRTAPKLVDLYKKRLKKLEGYRTAIIFPEQLLNLSQSSIYRVKEEKVGESSSVTITAINKFIPEINYGELKDAHAIFETEANDSDMIVVGGKVFMDLMLFTSKNDAVKYATKRLEANL